MSRRLRRHLPAIVLAAVMVALIAAAGAFVLASHVGGAAAATAVKSKRRPTVLKPRPKPLGERTVLEEDDADADGVADLIEQPHESQLGAAQLCGVVNDGDMKSARLPWLLLHQPSLRRNPSEPRLIRWEGSHVGADRPGH